MQLILEIQNPNDWETLISFLQQKGIGFQLTGKKSNLRQQNLKKEIMESLEWVERHQKGKEQGIDAYQLLEELRK